jgi:hypothetical protein
MSLVSTNIISAIITALGALSVTVERNADAPISPTVNGHIVVRDVSPEILDATLGKPPVFYLRLSVPIDIYMIGDTDKSRAERLSALEESIYQTILTDSALLVLCNHIEITSSETSTLFEDGARPVDAVTLTLNAEYDSTSGIG